ncbi:MAG: TonB-dependent receptor, partial [Bacteroidetes bacterium]
MAQTSLQGKVTDENGEPLLFANVVLKKNGNFVTGTETDLDGNYSIGNIDPGTYEVEVSYLGYPTQRITGVVVYNGKANRLDITMSSEGGIVLEEVVVKEYKVPLIEQDNTSTGGTLTSEQIEKLPTRNVNALAATTAGIASSDEGGALNVKGSRSNATNYYLDGVRVFGRMVPQTEIDQLQVITGGIEAQYGDVTGGIISITTKGPSSRFTGGVEVETSEFLDPYGYNLINGNVSGPLLKNKNGESVLGFRLAGQLLKQRDDDPPAIPVYRVKDEVLQEMEANPITILGGGAAPIGEQYTNEHVNALDYKPYEDRQTVDLTFKLDARLSKA